MRYARIALCIVATGSTSLIHANETSKYYGVLRYGYEQSYFDNYDADSHLYSFGVFPTGIDFSPGLPKFPIDQINATTSIYIRKKNNSTEFNDELYDFNLNLISYGVRIVGFDRGLFLNLEKTQSKSSDFPNYVDADVDFSRVKYGLGFGLDKFVITYSYIFNKVTNSFYLGEKTSVPNFILSSYLESVIEKNSSRVDLNYVSSTSSGTLFEINLALEKSEESSKYESNDYYSDSNDADLAPFLGSLIESTEISNDTESDYFSSFQVSLFPRDDLELIVGVLNPSNGSGELTLGIYTFQFDRIQTGIRINGADELNRANFSLSYLF